MDPNKADEIGEEVAEAVAEVVAEEVAEEVAEAVAEEVGEETPVETIANAEVEIAQINADKDIAIEAIRADKEISTAEIYTQEREAPQWQEEMLASLREQNRMLQTVVDLLIPPASSTMEPPEPMENMTPQSTLDPTSEMEMEVLNEKEDEKPEPNQRRKRRAI